MTVANSHCNPWNAIFQAQGRFFPEPFPRFYEILNLFQESGCVRILDLGCGSGRHTVEFAQHGFRVTGMDSAAAGLSLAYTWLRDEGLPTKLVQADMRFPLPFADGSFDAILSTQVIHHAIARVVQGTIDEIWRVLVTGGLAFVTVAAQTDEGEAFEEIEPGTFVPLTGPEAGLPHHIFTEQELRTSFGRFSIRETSLRAEGKVLTILAAKL